MKVTGDWINIPATQSVCAMLVQAGYQALFVGGCVRNALLDEPVGDIDIATDARPETVLALAKAAGIKAVPTGIDHGTVTVIVDQVAHEITTFRKDVETHGRHATVAFSDDVIQDARRRDFTMNALYARPDGTVIDPLGGIDDLTARRVRFIDDAGQRIREDYLRSLRFFRFHAWYGDPARGIDADGLAAVAAHLDGLDGLSRERVGAEMTKLLTAPDPAPSVAAMRMAGVLARVLPGAEDRMLAPLVEIERILDIPANAMRRLAVMGGEAMSEKLRLSKAQTRQLDLLRTEMALSKSPAELGYRVGAETGMDVIVLRAALFETPPGQGIAKELEQGALAKCPVVAADLMPKYQGRALGQQLERLEQRWIGSGFTLSKDDLLHE